MTSAANRTVAFAVSSISSADHKYLKLHKEHNLSPVPKKMFTKTEIKQKEDYTEELEKSI